MLKNFVLKMLEGQTKRFLKKHKPKLVAITGSIGKTSTKLYAATVLSQRLRVMTHYGNHNTHFSVPLAIFDIHYPKNIRNPFVWFGVWLKMEAKIHKQFDYDVILLELGTDHPGEIPHFATYLKPDIAVITSVTEEHMEFFKTMDAVAKEELAIANFSDLTLINRDDIDAVYAKYVTSTNIDTYGDSGVAEYHYLIEDFEPGVGFKGKFISPEAGELPVKLKLIGEHSIKAAVAAGALGLKLGLTPQEVVRGMEEIMPVSGRMQLLRGLKDTTIIDDTYNSNPKAALAALQTLYLFPGKQKIAILGSMNELGDFSKQAHEQVGAACDPTLLDWIVTVGDEAERYLAPAAGSKGCQVRSFKSPYEAGGFVHSVMHPGAVILAKGSQNGVFTEESVKTLLHNTEEEAQLVRQEPEWMAVKYKQFNKFPESAKTKT